MKKSKSTAVYKVNILTFSSFHCINDKFTFSLKFGNCIFNYSLKAHLCFSAKKNSRNGKFEIMKWKQSMYCYGCVVNWSNDENYGNTVTLLPCPWVWKRYVTFQ